MLVFYCRLITDYWDFVFIFFLANSMNLRIVSKFCDSVA